jgi:DNA-binding winged helix-turn-helix (wHTH) protein
MDPFGIGDHHVEPAANLIGGQRIDSKAMEVLLCLARAAPEVVSHARLLECVWPHVVVGDNVVHQAVAHLRKALGDDARSPRYIETIPRRGYRLLVEPKRDVVTSDRYRLETSNHSLDRSAGGIEANAGRSFRNSIAVLPFVNVSPEPDQEHFSDGLCEALINLLARNPDLKVTSRTSAFHFKHRTTDLPTIARQLGTHGEQIPLASEDFPVYVFGKFELDTGGGARDARRSAGPPSPQVVRGTALPARALRATGLQGRTLQGGVGSGSRQRRRDGPVSHRNSPGAGRRRTRSHRNGAETGLQTARAGAAPNAHRGDRSRRRDRSRNRSGI